MNIQIKPEYKGAYPATVRDKTFQFISAAIHPVYNAWVLLVLAPDGEFLSVERKHAKLVTKLEEVLK
jgi:hypothetical protein